MNPRHSIPRVQIKPMNPFRRFGDEEIEQSIPERFEQQVRAYGHRLAIKSDEATFSFDDVNQTANKLARRILSRRGDQVEPIALLFDHGAGVIAAMLGVLKTAKFYLVLDPTYPHDRLMQMLEDSGAQLIVADTQNLALARDLCHEATENINFNDPTENPSGVNVGIYPAPEQLAMILYTSGSTGRPKGVMHTHKNVLVDARNLTNEWCISAQDRWLLHTSASFANSVRTIYGSLLNGAALYHYAKKRGSGSCRTGCCPILKAAPQGRSGAAPGFQGIQAASLPRPSHVVPGAHAAPLLLARSRRRLGMVGGRRARDQGGSGQSPGDAPGTPTPCSSSGAAAQGLLEQGINLPLSEPASMKIRREKRSCCSLGSFPVIPAFRVCSGRRNERCGFLS